MYILYLAMCYHCACAQGLWPQYVNFGILMETSSKHIKGRHFVPMYPAHVNQRCSSEKRCSVRYDLPPTV